MLNSRSAAQLAGRGARRLVPALVPPFVHVAPSVLVLGQFLPDSAPARRTLPGGLCRWRGPDTGRREVALTFDDGPDPSTTPEILQLLGAAGMRATFFCLGRQLEREPDLVREIAASGHEVATHGFCHAHHLVRTLRYVTKDLARALEVHEKLGPSCRPVHFRPPYGQISAASAVASRLAGLDIVLWSAWGREWRDRDPVSVAARIKRRLEPGAIVLLHDSDATSPPGTAAIARRALVLVLEELERRELQSVPLSELVRPPAGYDPRQALRTVTN